MPANESHIHPEQPPDKPMIVALYALSAAVMNGSADFLGGTAARRLRPAVVVAWSQFLGLAVTLAVGAVWGRHATSTDLALGTGTGLALASALLVLYRGLSNYKMSVVSPVAAVSSALVPVGWGLAHREQPSAVTVFGILVAVTAVLAISGAFERSTDSDISTAPRSTIPGVLHGIGAGACFGIVLVLLSNIDSDSGLWPIAAARASAVVVLVFVLVSLGQFQRVTRAELPILAACGILGVGGHVAVVVASGTGSVVIVGVLASLYPAATVSLARIVDHEPLSRWQQIGLPLALASVAMLVVG